MRPPVPIIRLLLASALGSLLLATPGPAAVTITDCSSDPHCIVWNKRTIINIPSDTAVIAGSLVPLPGTSRIRVTARAIVVDGASGGQLTTSGTGKSLEMESLTSIIVTGNLLSTNSNGKILLKARDFVQIQSPAVIQSGGYIRVGCISAGCPLDITGTHFRAKRMFLTALGDVIWDQNVVESFGPRDLVFISAAKGSIRKSAALAVAFGGAPAGAPAGARAARAAAVAADTPQKVTAASEAAAFCETCQQGTPTVTPSPEGTASLPLGTPSPTEPVETPTGPTPTSTAPTPTGATPTETPPGEPTPTGPTPTGVTPTPIATPTPACTSCGGGGTESTLIMTAAGGIDIGGQRYSFARMITLKAGGPVDLGGTELRNDFGKCGEITVTTAGPINIEGATLVDDDCQNKPDLSNLNGRTQLPHTGVNNVVGAPALDD